MSLPLLFLVSIVPGALWVWFFARRDPNIEPAFMLARTFLAGALAVIPAAILEAPLRSILLEPAGLTGPVIAAVLAIGLIEEGVKLGATYFAAFRSKHFDEKADGIVYAITAALGFAAVENVFYTLAFGLQVAAIRAVVTSLAHASFAGVFGLSLGLFKSGKTSLAGVFTGYLLAAGIHAGYDLIVVLRLVSPLVALALVYGVYRYVVGNLSSTRV